MARLDPSTRKISEYPVPLPALSGPGVVRATFSNPDRVCCFTASSMVQTAVSISIMGNSMFILERVLVLLFLFLERIQRMRGSMISFVSVHMSSVLCPGSWQLWLLHKELQDGGDGRIQTMTDEIDHSTATQNFINILNISNGQIT